MSPYNNYTLSPGWEAFVEVSEELEKLKAENAAQTERVREAVRILLNDLDEADKLGYSHQSTGSIRYWVDKLAEAFNGPEKT